MAVEKGKKYLIEIACTTLGNLWLQYLHYISSNAYYLASIEIFFISQLS